jgi:transmembrane sensor
MENDLNRNREDAESAAAAWIARRERDDWSEATEARLRAWIDEDMNHRAAWLRLNAAWQQTERLRALSTTSSPGTIPARDEIRLPFDQPAHKEALQTIPQKKRYRALAAAAVLAALAIGAAYLASMKPSYHTAIGALQAVPLADGSRVTLNTNTQIHVAVSQSERHIDLEQGEAYFEVAKDPSRPFVVDAGSKRIIAVGTQFSVRRDAGDVQVIVTEGVVRVEDRQRPAGSKLPNVTLLTAGGIAHARSDGVLVQRKPLADVEQAMSWRSGYLIFDQTPLAQAVAEFNRYNTRQIVVESPSVASIPVGGNFRAANVDAFVRLIESDFPVVSIQQGDRIILKAGDLLNGK